MTDSGPGGGMADPQTILACVTIPACSVSWFPVSIIVSHRHHSETKNKDSEEGSSISSPPSSTPPSNLSIQEQHHQHLKEQGPLGLGWTWESGEDQKEAPNVGMGVYSGTKDGDRRGGKGKKTKNSEKATKFPLERPQRDGNRKPQFQQETL